MKQTLALRMGQQLAMTPQLQQAIRLMQLSVLELKTEVRQTIEANPMLDLVEESDDDLASDTGEDPFDDSIGEDVLDEEPGQQPDRRGGDAREHQLRHPPDGACLPLEHGPALPALHGNSGLRNRPRHRPLPHAPRSHMGLLSGA